MLALPRRRKRTRGPSSELLQRPDPCSRLLTGCIDTTPHCREVFEALDRTEGILAKQRWIAGDQFTEADIRLFVTLIRSCPC